MEIGMTKLRATPPSTRSPFQSREEVYPTASTKESPCVALEEEWLRFIHSSPSPRDSQSLTPFSGSTTWSCSASGAQPRDTSESLASYSSTRDVPFCISTGENRPWQALPGHREPTRKAAWHLEELSDQTGLVHAHSLSHSSSGAPCPRNLPACTRVARSQRQDVLESPTTSGGGTGARLTSGGRLSNVSVCRSPAEERLLQFRGRTPRRSKRSDSISTLSSPRGESRWHPGLGSTVPASSAKGYSSSRSDDPKSPRSLLFAGRTSLHPALAALGGARFPGALPHSTRQRSAYRLSSASLLEKTWQLSNDTHTTSAEETQGGRHGHGCTGANFSTYLTMKRACSRRNSSPPSEDTSLGLRFEELRVHQLLKTHSLSARCRTELSQNPRQPWTGQAGARLSSVAELSRRDQFEHPFSFSSPEDARRTRAIPFWKDLPLRRCPSLRTASPRPPRSLLPLRGPLDCQTSYSLFGQVSRPVPLSVTPLKGVKLPESFMRRLRQAPYTIDKLLHSRPHETKDQRSTQGDSPEGASTLCPRPHSRAPDCCRRKAGEQLLAPRQKTECEEEHQGIPSARLSWSVKSEPFSWRSGASPEEAGGSSRTVSSGCSGEVRFSRLGEEERVRQQRRSYASEVYGDSSVSDRHKGSVLRSTGAAERPNRQNWCSSLLPESGLSPPKRGRDGNGDSVERDADATSPSDLKETRDEGGPGQTSSPCTDLRSPSGRSRSKDLANSLGGEVRRNRACLDFKGQQTELHPVPDKSTDSLAHQRRVERSCRSSNVLYRDKESGEFSSLHRQYLTDGASGGSGSVERHRRVRDSCLQSLCPTRTEGEKCLVSLCGNVTRVLGQCERRSSDYEKPQSCCTPRRYAEPASLSPSSPEHFPPPSLSPAPSTRSTAADRHARDSHRRRRTAAADLSAGDGENKRGTGEASSRLVPGRCDSAGCRKGNDEKKRREAGEESALDEASDHTSPRSRTGKEEERAPRAEQFAGLPDSESSCEDGGKLRGTEEFPSISSMKRACPEGLVGLLKKRGEEEGSLETDTGTLGLEEQAIVSHAVDSSETEELSRGASAGDHAHIVSDPPLSPAPRLPPHRETEHRKEQAGSSRGAGFLAERTQSDTQGAGEEPAGEWRLHCNSSRCPTEDSFCLDTTERDGAEKLPVSQDGEGAHGCSAGDVGRPLSRPGELLPDSRTFRRAETAPVSSVLPGIASLLHRLGVASSDSIPSFPKQFCLPTSAYAINSPSGYRETGDPLPSDKTQPRNPLGKPVSTERPATTMTSVFHTLRKRSEGSEFDGVDLQTAEHLSEAKGESHGILEKRVEERSPSLLPNGRLPKVFTEQTRQTHDTQHEVAELENLTTTDGFTDMQNKGALPAGLESRLPSSQEWTASAKICTARSKEDTGTESECRRSLPTGPLKKDRSFRDHTKGDSPLDAPRFFPTPDEQVACAASGTEEGGALPSRTGGLSRTRTVLQSKQSSSSGIRSHHVRKEKVKSFKRNKPKKPRRANRHAEKGDRVAVCTKPGSLSCSWVMFSSQGGLPCPPVEGNQTFKKKATAEASPTNAKESTPGRPARISQLEGREPYVGRAVRPLQNCENHLLSAPESSPSSGTPETPAETSSGMKGYHNYGILSVNPPVEGEARCSGDELSGEPLSCVSQCPMISGESRETRRSQSDGPLPSEAANCRFSFSFEAEGLSTTSGDDPGHMLAVPEEPPSSELSHANSCRPSIASLCASRSLSPSSSRTVSCLDPTGLPTSSCSFPDIDPLSEPQSARDMGIDDLGSSGAIGKKLSPSLLKLLVRCTGRKSVTRPKAQEAAETEVESKLFDTTKTPNGGGVGRRSPAGKGPGDCVSFESGQKSVEGRPEVPAEEQDNLCASGSPELKGEGKSNNRGQRKGANKEPVPPEERRGANSTQRLMLQNATQVGSPAPRKRTNLADCTRESEPQGTRFEAAQGLESNREQMPRQQRTVNEGGLQKDSSNTEKETEEDESHSDSSDLMGRTSALSGGGCVEHDPEDTAASSRSLPCEPAPHGQLLPSRVLSLSPWPGFPRETSTSPTASLEVASRRSSLQLQAFSVARRCSSMHSSRSCLLSDHSPRSAPPGRPHSPPRPCVGAPSPSVSPLFECVPPRPHPLRTASAACLDSPPTSRRCSPRSCQPVHLTEQDEDEEHLENDRRHAWHPRTPEYRRPRTPERSGLNSLLLCRLYGRVPAPSSSVASSARSSAYHLSFPSSRVSPCHHSCSVESSNSDFHLPSAYSLRPSATQELLPEPDVPPPDFSTEACPQRSVSSSCCSYSPAASLASDARSEALIHQQTDTLSKPPTSSSERESEDEGEDSNAPESACLSLFPGGASAKSTRLVPTESKASAAVLPSQSTCRDRQAEPDSAHVSHGPCESYSALSSPGLKQVKRVLEKPEVLPELSRSSPSHGTVCQEQHSESLGLGHDPLPLSDFCCVNENTPVCSQLGLPLTVGPLPGHCESGCALASVQSLNSNVSSPTFQSSTQVDSVNFPVLACGKARSTSPPPLPPRRAVAHVDEANSPEQMAALGAPVSSGGQSAEGKQESLSPENASASSRQSPSSRTPLPLTKQSTDSIPFLTRNADSHSPTALSASMSFSPASRVPGEGCATPSNVDGQAQRTGGGTGECATASASPNTGVKSVAATEHLLPSPRHLHTSLQTQEECAEGSAAAPALCQSCDACVQSISVLVSEEQHSASCPSGFSAYTASPFVSPDVSSSPRSPLGCLHTPRPLPTSVARTQSEASQLLFDYPASPGPVFSSSFPSCSLVASLPSTLLLQSQESSRTAWSYDRLCEPRTVSASSSISSGISSNASVASPSSSSSSFPPSSASSLGARKYLDLTSPTTREPGKKRGEEEPLVDAVNVTEGSLAPPPSSSLCSRDCIQKAESLQGSAAGSSGKSSERLHHHPDVDGVYVETEGRDNKKVEAFLAYLVDMIRRSDVCPTVSLARRLASEVASGGISDAWREVPEEEADQATSRKRAADNQRKKEVSSISPDPRLQEAEPRRPEEGERALSFSQAGEETGLPTNTVPRMRNDSCSELRMRSDVGRPHRDVCKEERGFGEKEREGSGQAACHTGGDPDKTPGDCVRSPRDRGERKEGSSKLDHGGTSPPGSREPVEEVGISANREEPQKSSRDARVKETSFLRLRRGKHLSLRPRVRGPSLLQKKRSRETRGFRERSLDVKARDVEESRLEEEDFLITEPSGEGMSRRGGDHTWMTLNGRKKEKIGSSVESADCGGTAELPQALGEVEGKKGTREGETATTKDEESSSIERALLGLAEQQACDSHEERHEADNAFLTDDKGQEKERARTKLQAADLQIDREDCGRTANSEAEASEGEKGMPGVFLRSREGTAELENGELSGHVVPDSRTDGEENGGGVEESEIEIKQRPKKEKKDSRREDDSASESSLGSWSSSRIAGTEEDKRPPAAFAGEPTRAERPSAYTTERGAVRRPPIDAAGGGQKEVSEQATDKKDEEELKQTKTTDAETTDCSGRPVVVMQKTGCKKEQKRASPISEVDEEEQTEEEEVQVGVKGLKDTEAKKCKKRHDNVSEEGVTCADSRKHGTKTEGSTPPGTTTFSDLPSSLESELGLLDAIRKLLLRHEAAVSKGRLLYERREELGQKDTDACSGLPDEGSTAEPRDGIEVEEEGQADHRQQEDRGREEANEAQMTSLSSPSESCEFTCTSVEGTTPRAATERRESREEAGAESIPRLTGVDSLSVSLPRGRETVERGTGAQALLNEGDVCQEKEKSANALRREHPTDERVSDVSLVGEDEEDRGIEDEQEDGGGQVPRTRKVACVAKDVEVEEDEATERPGENGQPVSVERSLPVEHTSVCAEGKEEHGQREPSSEKSPRILPCQASVCKQEEQGATAAPTGGARQSQERKDFLMYQDLSPCSTALNEQQETPMTAKMEDEETWLCQNDLSMDSALHRPAGDSREKEDKKATRPERGALDVQSAGDPRQVEDDGAGYSEEGRKLQGCDENGQQQGADERVDIQGQTKDKTSRKEDKEDMAGHKHDVTEKNCKASAPGKRASVLKPEEEKPPERGRTHKKTDLHPVDVELPGGGLDRRAVDEDAKQQGGGGEEGTDQARETPAIGGGARDTERVFSARRTDSSLSCSGSSIVLVETQPGQDETAKGTAVTSKEGLVSEGNVPSDSAVDKGKATTAKKAAVRPLRHRSRTLQSTRRSSSRLAEQREETKEEKAEERKTEGSAEGQVSSKKPEDACENEGANPATSAPALPPKVRRKVNMRRLEELHLHVFEKQRRVRERAEALQREEFLRIEKEKESFKPKPPPKFRPSRGLLGPATTGSKGESGRSRSVFPAGRKPEGRRRYSAGSASSEPLTTRVSSGDLPPLDVEKARQRTGHTALKESEEKFSMKRKGTSAEEGAEQGSRVRRDKADSWCPDRRSSLAQKRQEGNDERILVEGKTEVDRAKTSGFADSEDESEDDTIERGSRSISIPKSRQGERLSCDATEYKNPFSRWSELERLVDAVEGRTALLESEVMRGCYGPTQNSPSMMTSPRQSSEISSSVLSEKTFLFSSLTESRDAARRPEGVNRDRGNDKSRALRLLQEVEDRAFAAAVGVLRSLDQSHRKSKTEEDTPTTTVEGCSWDELDFFPDTSRLLSSSLKHSLSSALGESNCSGLGVKDGRLGDQNESSKRGRPTHSKLGPVPGRVQGDVEKAKSKQDGRSYLSGLDTDRAGRKEERVNTKTGLRTGTPVRRPFKNVLPSRDDGAAELRGSKRCFGFVSDKGKSAPGRAKSQRNVPSPEASHTNDEDLGRGQDESRTLCGRKPQLGASEGGGVEGGRVSRTGCSSMTSARGYQANETAGTARSSAASSRSKDEQTKATKAGMTLGSSRYSSDVSFPSVHPLTCRPMPAAGAAPGKAFESKSALARSPRRPRPAVRDNNKVTRRDALTPPPRSLSARFTRTPLQRQRTHAEPLSRASITALDTSVHMISKSPNSRECNPKRADASDGTSLHAARASRRSLSPASVLSAPLRSSSKISATPFSGRAVTPRQAVWKPAGRAPGWKSGGGLRNSPRRRRSTRTTAKRADRPPGPAASWTGDSLASPRDRSARAKREVSPPGKTARSVTLSSSPALDEISTTRETSTQTWLKTTAGGSTGRIPPTGRCGGAAVDSGCSRLCTSTRLSSTSPRVRSREAEQRATTAGSRTPRSLLREKRSSVYSREGSSRLRSKSRGAGGSVLPVSEYLDENHTNRLIEKYAALDTAGTKSPPLTSPSRRYTSSSVVRERPCERTAAHSTSRREGGNGGDRNSKERLSECRDHRGLHHLERTEKVASSSAIDRRHVPNTNFLMKKTTNADPVEDSREEFPARWTKVVVDTCKSTNRKQELSSSSLTHHGRFEETVQDQFDSRLPFTDPDRSESAAVACDSLLNRLEDVQSRCPPDFAPQKPGARECFSRNEPQEMSRCVVPRSSMMLPRPSQSPSVVQGLSDDDVPPVRSATRKTVPRERLVESGEGELNGQFLGPSEVMHRNGILGAEDESMKGVNDDNFCVETKRAQRSPRKTVNEEYFGTEKTGPFTLKRFSGFTGFEPPSLDRIESLLARISEMEEIAGLTAKNAKGPPHAAGGGAASAGPHTTFRQEESEGSGEREEASHDSKVEAAMRRALAFPGA